MSPITSWLGKSPFAYNLISNGGGLLHARIRKVALWSLGVVVWGFILLMVTGHLSDGPSSLPFNFSHPSPIPSLPRYHLVLPLSHLNTPFCRTLSTLLINDWKTNVLQFSEMDMLPGLPNFLAKVTGTKRFLERKDLKDDDLVILVDSMDAWAQYSPEHFIETYFAIRRSEIVFSAERNCYPFPADSPECQIRPSISPIPVEAYGGAPAADYLNSGFVVGPVKAMRPFYDEAVERLSRASREHLTDKEYMNDQSMMQRLYLSSQFPVSLDHTHNLTVSMAWMGDNPPTITFDPLPPHGLRNGLRVIPSNTFPTFVHFNGKMKGFTTYWSNMWWSIEGEVERERKVEAWKKVVTGEVEWTKEEEITMRSWQDVCGTRHDLAELKDDGGGEFNF